VTIRREGSLEVIVGPMFSGKTHELLRRASVAELHGDLVVAARPSTDTRSARDAITSHHGEQRPAEVVVTAAALEAFEEFDVLVIDEAHFFDTGIVDVVSGLRPRGRVILAGLGRDFRAAEFPSVSHVIDGADVVTWMTARCARCGGMATLTQRLIDGRPAPLDDPVIKVGAEDLYQPRCERCYWLERRG
jgi:thymidine kinase